MPPFDDPSLSDSSDTDDASQPTQPTQPTQTQSQVKGEIIFKLCNAEMRVLSFCVLTPGQPMNAKLEFTLKNGQKKIVDLLYTNDVLKNSRKIIINKCEQYMWLEAVRSDLNDKYFPDYIDQQLKLFDQNNNPVDITRKSILELTKPSIKKIDDDYYWIWGPKEVHHLNHVRSEGPGHYTSKLSEDDILNLPVELVYVGIGVNHFLDDEKKAFDILLQIIMKMNMMQDTKFYSFPLASFCSHLSAFLYKILVVSHKGFKTTLVLSGSGSTPRTGKSLMTSMGQLMFLGYWPRQMIKVSESTVFDELDKGRTVYLREWAKHEQLLNVTIPMVWESLGRNVRGKEQDVNAVVFVDANLSPEDISLDNANETKVTFIATGSTPLEHANRMQLCQEMEDLARELYTYLPVLLGLGLCSMLKQITDLQLEDYKGILKQKKDDREGQVLLNYDRVHTALDDAIVEYDLERPLLFQCGFIDRTALTFYNNKEDALSIEDMAEMIAEYILEKNLKSSVEYSERTNSFKLKLLLSSLPQEVYTATKAVTKETSTFFAGKHAVKVRMLFVNLLKDEHVNALKDLKVSHNFSDWVERMLEQQCEKKNKLALDFYRSINPPGPVEVEDEFDMEPDNTRAGPSNQPVELRCTLSGCPAKNNLFKNDRTFRKHLVSMGHKKAAQKKKEKAKK